MTERAEPTLRARMSCAKWLTDCLRFGWHKYQLDDLEELWWKYHNFTGKLIAAVREEPSR